MSISGFMQIVTPPSRWWRRSYSINFNLTLWPKWIAQRLCPHKIKSSFSPDGADIWRCEDCYKFNFPYEIAHKMTEKAVQQGNVPE